MASLTGKLVAETYKALLKTIDNDILTASEKQITDGFGGGSNVFIDSQGFLRANKYKVTNGLATHFLKADGSLDSNTYLTGITSSQIITALGYTPVPTTRTLTINGTTYDLSANRSWTIAGTAAVWGNISGTLSNQTDLQTALNAKYNNPTGTISQYIRGDGSLATFPTLPGGLPTGGTTGQILAKIDATYYNAHWIDNYATQTKNEVKLGQTLTKGTPVYVSSANGTNMIVSAASNTSEALSSKTFGLLETGGATNAFVKCVTFGLLAGLDTSTAQAGDPVWLGVNGALIFGLANKPYAPAHLVYIGVVTRVQQNNGEIFVNVQNGFELKEIHDVYIADPANNHGLFYDLADGLWKNKSIASALGYTPQAQLNGTGFVKASGTTITYDNSTYLTTTDAASTYQRLDKMVSNLLASATEYPNSNAVINALALKADALNPVFTGYMTISGVEPKLYFTDTDQNPDYFIGADAGFFRIYDQTAGATRFVINSSGVTTIAGDLIVGTIAKSGGTATQFLKADGSIDSSTYVTSASLANYLLISTAASTYQRLDKMVSNLLASDTEYPNSNAVLAKLALKADAANPVFTGDMTISGISPKLYFTDTDNNPDYTLFVDSGYFYIYDQTAGATKFQITPSGNAINTGTLTSASFIKSGGTSSQFLMADGSVTTLSNIVTGSGTTNYLPKWTSGSALGNSVIYEINSKVFIGTITESSYKLDVNAGAVSGISVTNSAQVLSLAVYNTTYNTIIRFTSVANPFWDLQANTDGSFQIDRSDTAVLSFATSGAATFSNYVTSNTNLGFRNSNPSQAGLIADFTGAGALMVSISTYTDTFNIYNETNAYSIISFARATKLITINPTGGNVIIGTTTDLGYKFNVEGTGRFSSNLYTATALYINTTAAYGFKINSEGNNGFYNRGGSTGSHYPFLLENSSGLMLFQILGTGAATFSSSSARMILFNSSNANGPYAGWQSSGSDEFYIGKSNAIGGGGGFYDIYSNAAGGGLRFFTNGNVSPAMTINTSNYVDIDGLRLKGTDSGNTIYVGNRNMAITAESGYNIGIGRSSDLTRSLNINTTNGNVGMNTTSFTEISFGSPILKLAGSRATIGLVSSGSLATIAMMANQNTATAIHINHDLSGNTEIYNYAAGAVVVNIKSNGNFLIGTTTDNGTKLNVNAGSASGINVANAAAVLSLSLGNSTNNTILRMTSSSNAFWDLQANTDGTFQIDRGDVAAITFATSRAATFSSSVTATSFFESSDFRLKTLINDNPIIRGIERLEAKLYEKNGKMELGYFAQDAEKLMPYAVTKNEDGFLNLSYREVHTAKIARLEQRVAELEKQLNLN